MESRRSRSQIGRPRLASITWRSRMTLLAVDAHARARIFRLGRYRTTWNVLYPAPPAGFALVFEVIRAAPPHPPHPSESKGRWEYDASVGAMQQFGALPSPANGTPVWAAESSPRGEYQVLKKIQAIEMP